MNTKLNINVIEDGSITKSKLSEDITGSLDSVSNKADKATTLSGYGITDAYDKTEIESKVSDINANIDSKLSKSGGVMSGSITSHSIVPETNLKYNLGGSLNKYKEIFSQYVNSDRLYGRLDARYIDTMDGTFTQVNTTSPFVNLVSKGSVNIFAGASSTELKVERWSGSLGENATWEDFSNDEDTIKNVTGVFSDLYRPSNYLNVAYGETAAVGDKIRITFLPNNRYSYLHFILINFSTNGGKHVITIEKNTWNTTNATYNDDWTVVHDAKSISGWSGFNVYSMTSSNVFGQTSNTNGYGIRFTIELTELTYPQYNCNGAIYSIRGFTLQYPFANPSKSSNNNLRLLGVPYFTDEQRMIYTDNGVITKGQVSPYSNKQYDMGSSSLMWNNVYSNKYYENGIDISTKYALKSELIDTNYYPTTFSWIDGTISGPTGSLTGSGMSAISFGAIPSASSSVSGIVTTGDQTFGGTKIFSTINTNNINNNGETLSIINNSTSNTSNDFINIESTNGQISLVSKSGVIVLDSSNNIGTITANLIGNADTASNADKLSTSRIIDGVSFDGSKNIVNYYYCESIQASDKVINLNGFTLIPGSRIIVKFRYPNKADDNITILNVGTYPIHYRGQTLQANFWTAYQCVEFVFDNTQFNIVAGTPYSATSDERLKDIIGDNDKLNIDVIANAPSKIYSLKDDYFKTEYIGTIAQYWEDKVPQAILHQGGNLGVDYAPLALCSTITLAKEVVEL